MARPPSSSWWRPLSRSDRRALLVLLAVPLAVFVLPAALGYPALAQDNYIQNFPLRYLSGLQLRSGHLPLFNVLTNSGTPLLGGMNSGSLYPLTVIFALVPAIAAWVINLVAVYLSASVGLFALVRWLGVRTNAACVAALVFAYSGAMMGQMVHLAVVQGFALLPWMILIQLWLLRQMLSMSAGATLRERWRAAAPATLGLAALWGLTFLTGEPRAIAELQLAALVVVAYGLLLPTDPPASRWRGRIDVLLVNAVGVVWGAAVGLVQLLPGWAFIGVSQRSVVDYSFFGSGSLNTKWTVLLFLQDAFGGNQVLGYPHYFNNYNLAEVTGYVGIVGLTALAAFFARITRRGWPAEERRFAVFAVLAIVGLVAAWGSFTPLGHLFHALPFFGRTRLQSRNIVLFDLGAAVLVGWWLDAVASRRFHEAALSGRRRVVTALPAVATVVLGLVIIALPRPFYRFMEVREWLLPQAQFVRVNMVVHVVIAALVLTLVLTPWLRTSGRRWLLGVMCVDLALFNLFCDVSFYHGSWPVRPDATAVARTLQAGDGRTAMVDRTFANYGRYLALGATNVNVFTGVASIQGYGSLVSARYDDALAVHPLLGLDPCAVARGRAQQLDLRTLLIARSSLSEPLTPLTIPVTDCGVADDGVYHTRAFGEPLALRQIEVTVSDSSRVLAVGLMDRAGTLVERIVRRPSSDGRLSVSVPATAPMAYGIQVNSLSDTAGFTLLHAEVTTRDGVRLRLDEPFQIAVSRGDWSYVTTGDGYAQYTSAGSGRFWTNRQTPATTIRHHAALWGDEWATVNAPVPLTMWRSTAWLPGWRATATNLATGASRSLDVRRSALIQKVQLPPGRWRVHFHYHAPYIATGLCVSVVGTLTLFVGTWWYVRSRRRREGSLTS